MYVTPHLIDVMRQYSIRVRTYINYVRSLAFISSRLLFPRVHVQTIPIQIIILISANIVYYIIIKYIIMYMIGTIIYLSAPYPTV